MSSVYFMWRTYVCFTLCKVVCNEPRTAWIWYICRTVQHMWRLQLNVCSNVWVLLYRIYLYIYVYADLGSAVWQLKCNKLFAYRCFLSVCVLCCCTTQRHIFSFLFTAWICFVLTWRALCLGYSRAEALCKEYRQTKGPGTTAKPSEQLFFLKLGGVIKNTLEKCQRENGFMWVSRADVRTHAWTPWCTVFVFIRAAKSPQS